MVCRTYAWCDVLILRNLVALLAKLWFGGVLRLNQTCHDCGQFQLWKRMRDVRLPEALM